MKFRITIHHMISKFLPVIKVILGNGVSRKAKKFFSIETGITVIKYS